MNWFIGALLSAPFAGITAILTTIGVAGIKRHEAEA